jgi:hypothetical protein
VPALGVRGLFKTDLRRVNPHPLRSSCEHEIAVALSLRGRMRAGCLRVSVHRGAALQELARASAAGDGTE